MQSMDRDDYADQYKSINCDPGQFFKKNSFSKKSKSNPGDQDSPPN